MQKIHLICNAHLDPVWLWQWEEGAAEALSTFRIAADFCEQYDGFIFNHNEAILYEWVEEYDAELFERIRKLVKAGKWHIMGGWYLQPDCNLPSGEGIARQILAGQKYFREKFAVAPKVGINFDPFGHSRGMVQMLKQCGYTGYMFCKPQSFDRELPDEHFCWVGLDGSELMAARADDLYLSLRGTARAKVEENMKKHSHRPVHFVLWGVGNHGGGPSRIDLKNLGKLIEETTDCEILHSTPENFFADLSKHYENLPKVEHSINHYSVGCYSSAAHIKQTYRALENELFATEKILSSAVLHGLLKYPHEDLATAQRDLLFAQFHDILPGSMTKASQDAALRGMEHGREILSRLKARAFFALAKDQKLPAGSDIPVMVYNPHPYKVRATIECEFQLADQNWSDTYTDFRVYKGKKLLPSQVEKEDANIPLDWRKRVVFEAELEPSSINRFDCKAEVLPSKPKLKCKTKNGKFVFDNGDMEVHINARTGFVDRYVVGSKNLLKPNAFRPLVIEDSCDAWGMNVKSFRKIAGRFTAMNQKDAAWFAGLHDGKLAAVRVIEDGAARTVIESLFSYGHSFISQRYYLPKSGSEFSIRTHVFWNERDAMLKLQVPLAMENCEYSGQTMFGCQQLDTTGNEMVAQKWVAAADKEKDLALTVINDGTYASDCKNDELRLTLFRSPAFTGHPLPGRTILPTDRFTLRMDQGEHVFNFTINAGKISERFDNVDREAAVINEKPFAVSFFPNGCGKSYGPAVKLSDKTVQLSAVKFAENNNDLIVRMYEPTGKKRTTMLTIPTHNIKHKVTLKPYEIVTLKINQKKKKITQTNLIEE